MGILRTPSWIDGPVWIVHVSTLSRIVSGAVFRHFASLKVILSSIIPDLTFLGCDCMGLMLTRMTGDACIAGDAYPVDAPGLTPIYRSSCDSIFSFPVTLPIGLRYSTFIFIYLLVDEASNLFVFPCITCFFLRNFFFVCVFSECPSSFLILSY